MKSIIFGFAVLAAISSTSYATCREISGPKGTEEQLPAQLLAANRALMKTAPGGLWLCLQVRRLPLITFKMNG